MSPNWKNRTLFHGDNLAFLRAMNSGSVHLIATDPPFNKGKDFHATPDSLASGASFQDRWSWDNDVHPDWVDQIEDDWPNVMHVIKGSRASYGDDMGAFLCFMGVRLLEMRRILRDDGSIYLHCDPTASHYLKELMDAIFGKQNFLNEVIWYYRGAGVPKSAFARRHDVIFLYAKRAGKHFFNADPARQPYAQATVERFSHYIGNVRGVRDYGEQSLNPKGKHPDDVVTDIQPLAPSNKTERVGYPTQKPLSLYKRLIEASSAKGNVVFDPFAGCATTLVAAEDTGRKWVGCDLWEKAYETVIARLQKDDLMVRGHRKKGQQSLLTKGSVTFTKKLPERTDSGDNAVPFLKTKVKLQEPPGQRMTRDEIYKILLEQNGMKCQGCYREFDDQRYLELDHNTPRSDGGLNHISNRVLLCGPCNRLKSNTLTLSGLRKQNQKKGYMAKAKG